MPLTSEFHVLIIDDDDLDRMAVRRTLVATAPKVRIVEAESVSVGLATLVEFSFDCVILDFHLPDGTGLEVLTQVRSIGSTIPVIMLTGVSDAQSAVELMKAGATDYIPKSALSAERLERSLRYALRIRAADERVRRYTQQLRELSKAALRINATLSVETMLATTAHEARLLVGAHWAKAAIEPRSTDIMPLESISVSETCSATDACSIQGITNLLLGRDGTAIGTLYVTGKENGEFTETDHAIVAQLAQLASSSIENARLLDAAQAAARTRDDVLAIVSHDLRNPVQTIVMASTLLLELSPADDRRRIPRQQASIVLRAANRASRLIDDLLDATRIEAGTFAIELAPVAMDALLREVIELLQPLAMAAGVDLVADVSDEIPPILADSQRLLQVFSNLGGNAIKFTPQGGRVLIAASVDADGLRLSVVDTGRGIARTDLAHVFDRYWQGRERKQAGAGLGLWIAKGIVESHGGTIEVESEVGAGTTVRFTLPIASPSHRTERASLESPHLA